MHIGTDEITSLWMGELGIKTVLIGDKVIYERGGSCCYIILETEKEST